MEAIMKIFYLYDHKNILKKFVFTLSSKIILCYLKFYLNYTVELW